MKKKYGIGLLLSSGLIFGCTPSKEHAQTEAARQTNSAPTEVGAPKDGAAKPATEQDRVEAVREQNQHQKEKSMNQSLIIAFKEKGISQSQAENDVKAALSSVSAFKLEKMYDSTFTLKFNSNEDTASLLEALKKISSVDYVEVDQEVGLLKTDREQ